MDAQTAIDTGLEQRDVRALPLELRGLELPARIATLPRDARGYPVPWFVAWIDGVPDFRVIGPGKVAEAHRGRLCWLCGRPLGVFKAFVIGPMCAINRISSEPPSHVDCATFGGRACPFLARPHARRREDGLPAERVQPAGFGLKRNPGVALVWVTRTYEPMRAHAGNTGTLFQVGEPTECRWFAEGRPATRAEVEASIASGYPALRELAAREGAEALAALERQRAAADRYLPPA